MTFWREAGLNYVRYSQICAKIVRQCLKADLREAAAKRNESTVKAVMWKDGKPVPAAK
ncbi:hypothetical protein NP493_159g02009 [Ridgeia piscesae]|uniref:Uncharacterized protein n=1 Tax=Ridgeia piscesae TaxID=27915 RepID=A0AAD9P471_RIDPI|nr:hypothetical protein NP493_159g02009 [Ridgeia piscesae]